MLLLFIGLANHRVLSSLFCNRVYFWSICVAFIISLLLNTVRQVVKFYVHTVVNRVESKCFWLWQCFWRAECFTSLSLTAIFPSKDNMSGKKRERKCCFDISPLLKCHKLLKSREKKALSVRCFLKEHRFCHLSNGQKFRASPFKTETQNGSSIKYWV